MRKIRIADPRDRALNPPPPAGSNSRLGDLLATVPIILLVPALILAFIPVMASNRMEPSAPYSEGAKGATLTATPSAASAGTKIRIRGAGFEPRQRGDLLLDEAMVGREYRAGGTGNFSATFVIPSTARPGVYRLRAIQASAEMAEVGITVLAPGSSASGVPPDPTIGLDPAPSIVAATLAPTLEPTPAPTVPSPPPTLAPTLAPTPVPTLSPPPPTLAPTPAAVASWTEDFTAGLGAFAPYAMTWPNGQGVDGEHCSVSNGILRLRADFPPQRGCMVIGPTFDHGYFEARIKFAAGTGLSPAFWLRRPLSAPTPWDEVDFMEAYPNITGEIFQSTVHTYPGGVHSYKQLTVTKALSGGWHTYGALLVPGQRVDIYLDGVLQGSITQGVPAKQAFHIVLSHMAGNWSAQPDATTPNPAFMEVDWVRWYDTKP